MAEDRQPPLGYERPAGAPLPRWQFRLLFLLVLINLGITIQMAYAPGVSASIRQWWADYQAKRQRRALHNQARNWIQPAGTVVWEEDPDAAAKLRASGAYKSTPVPPQVWYKQFPFLAGWPAGAAAAPPAFASQLQRNFPIYGDDGMIPQQDDGWALVLLHGLKSGSGTERLVYVIVEGRITLENFYGSFVDGDPNPAPKEPQGGVATRRLRVIASAVKLDDAATKDPRPAPGETTELVVAPGGVTPWKAPWRWTPPADGRPAQLVLPAGNRFSFYAGQPDPADPAHFTMDYDLDGEKGTIDGRLKDDATIELKPRRGTMLTGQTWAPRG